MARVTSFSKFESGIIVVTLYSTDSEYAMVKEKIFSVAGPGCFVPSIPAILIDGDCGCNEDIINWVEAHEVGHYLLGHTLEKNPQDEIEADLVAYRLLAAANLPNQLVIDHFYDRHGIEFSNIQR